MKIKSVNAQEKKTARPESYRRQLARRLKQALAGEISFAKAALAGEASARAPYRRVIE